ncbi:hypothetical protein PMO01_18565 [Pseudomonas moraviensis R28-S]|uniref:Uncharacterized protein n=1 Tax=Pseudomonas moraviensis R28-S TaxID=1395516 RepID=V8R5B6_9PSED|nr:hypothetical protein PMO01_18565 [Pseudomonas moraviensis R28-S]
MAKIGEADIIMNIKMLYIIFDAVFAVLIAFPDITAFILKRNVITRMKAEVPSTM